MVFHPRLILAVLGPVLMASTLSCGRQESPDKATRHGEDVLASGGAPQVTDSVPGDAILAGGDVRFSGTTGGDYLGAGGKQTISGRIHGSLRAAGGEIHVTAVVDRNTTIAGGQVELDSGAVITRNAYLIGGRIRVNGTVQESLQAFGGEVVLNGLVGRDVEVAAGELRVGPRAQIAGNLRYRVKAEKVHIDPAARIAGTVTVLPVKGRGPLGVLWMFGFSFLVAGAVVVALVPRFATEAASILRERPGLSALVALGWIILVPVAMILAAITIIGIPLALITATVYVVLLYLGRVPLAVWIGERVLGARARTGRQGALVSFLVGGFILLVVGLVPVVGPLAMVIATIVGLGALLLRVHALREKQPV
jgi:cytoskeletal protein CcmA (bactofilin family)